MSDDLPALWLAITMALAACGLFVRDCVTRAHAQDRDDVVARCLVAEAPPGPDYGAILAVLSRRSSSLEWGALHYCALYVTRHPSPRQLAIRQLPGGPSARIYARHWQAAQDALRAFRAGDRSRCPASHFGDALEDARRARRAGWVRVDCGATANLYWTVPVRVASGAARPR